jgi:predicted PurR-regulated permease PerM
MGLFDRLRGGHAPTAEDATPKRTVVEIDATSLSRVFSAPMWLRDLGLLAWFLVGVAILLVGLTWLLGLTSTITMPVIVGAILATVAGPLVAKMQQHRIPRPAGAAVVLLGLVAPGIVIFLDVADAPIDTRPLRLRRSLPETYRANWLVELAEAIMPYVPPVAA